MTHNKYLTFLFLEDNDPISARTAAQMLSLNLADTFLILSFLFTPLSNSSVSCSCTPTLDLISLSNKIIDYTSQCSLISFIFKNSSNFISSTFQNLV